MEYGEIKKLIEEDKPIPKDILLEILSKAELHDNLVEFSSRNGNKELSEFRNVLHSHPEEVIAYFSKEFGCKYIVPQEKYVELNIKASTLDKINTNFGCDIEIILQVFKQGYIWARVPAKGRQGYLDKIIQINSGELELFFNEMRSEWKFVIDNGGIIWCDYLLKDYKITWGLTKDWWLNEKEEK